MADFDVSVQIVPLSGAALIDLNDIEGGYSVVGEPVPLDESVDKGEVASPFVNGRFPVWVRDDAAVLGVVVSIEGSSWAQVQTRRLALRTAYRSALSFFLDVRYQGVTTRYRAGRPDVSGEVTTENLMQNRLDLLLRFPVQPNPTVSGV